MTALSSAEQERSLQTIQVGKGHAQAALQLMSQQGPAMRAKLVQLAQLLLQLLDGFVMPADLVGSGEDLREALTRGQSSGSVTMAASATADASRYNTAHETVVGESRVVKMVEVPQGARGGGASVSVWLYVCCVQKLHWLVLSSRKSLASTAANSLDMSCGIVRCGIVRCKFVHSCCSCLLFGCVKTASYGGECYRIVEWMFAVPRDAA